MIVSNLATTCLLG